MSRRKKKRPARGPEQFVEAVRAAYGGTWRGPPYKPCCILCGATRVVMGGLWVPSPQVQPKLLVPSGKSRVVGYCLCAQCVRLPDRMVRVEDHVLGDFAAMSASPLRN